MTKKGQRRDDFVRFNLVARNLYAKLPGKNTSHMKLAWVKEWKASDWSDLPRADVKLISEKVRKFKANVKSLGEGKEQDMKLAVESISLLRAINVILLKNNISVAA